MADIEWHKPQPPTLNKHGDETHPAWGFIKANRVSATPGATLFDSDLKHGHYVVVTIGRMTRKRDLNRDWLHPERQEVEVSMSEAQWASFVSSMNTSGVPCTLQHLPGEFNIPGIEDEPRLKASMNEVKEAADKAFDRIQEAMAAVDALDPKAPIKERREAMAELRRAISHSKSNVEFAGKSLAEHTENVVARARVDVEAMVVDQARKIGVAVDDLVSMEWVESNRPAIESSEEQK